jgi:hypothetical protein
LFSHFDLQLISRQLSITIAFIVAQLDEIKTITVAGGLDDALSACANAVRSNFKAAKDKKATKGA